MKTGKKLAQAQQEIRFLELTQKKYRESLKHEAACRREAERDVAALCDERVDLRLQLKRALEETEEDTEQLDRLLPLAFGADWEGGTWTTKQLVDGVLERLGEALSLAADNQTLLSVALLQIEALQKFAGLLFRQQESAGAPPTTVTFEPDADFLEAMAEAGE